MAWYGMVINSYLSSLH